MSSIPPSEAALASERQPAELIVRTQNDDLSSFVPDSERSSSTIKVDLMSTSDSENVTVTSTPHLSQELIALILDALIEPYLYNLETGELNPYTASVVFVLRPVMLVSKSFAHYARRLGVRHLVLDFDVRRIGQGIARDLVFPTFRQLILHVNRHQLGGALRSLTLLCDYATNRGWEIESLELIAAFLGTLPRLHTLRLTFEESDLLCRGIIVRLLATRFPFQSHLKSLVQLRRGKDRFSILISLAKLYPNLERVEGFDCRGGNIADFLDGGVVTTPSHPLRLRAIEIKIQEGESQEEFSENNELGWALLSENSGTLQSLTLVVNFPFSPTTNRTSPLALPPFPQLRHLRFSDRLEPYIEIRPLLRALSALEVLEAELILTSETVQLLPPSIRHLTLLTYIPLKNLGTYMEVYRQLFARLVNLQYFKIEPGAYPQGKGELHSFNRYLYEECSARSIQFVTAWVNWEDVMAATEVVVPTDEDSEDNESREDSSSEDESESDYDSEYEGDFEMLSGDENF